TATPLTMLFRLRFFFKHTPPAELSPLSLHDALPILVRLPAGKDLPEGSPDRGLDLAPAQMRHALIHAQDAPFAIVHDDRVAYGRSEEHTSELQSLTNLVCRLLLEKKKTTPSNTPPPP